MDLERLVGLHPQDEMHAPFQIESELQLLGREPPGQRHPVSLRQNRVDPDGKKDHEDRNARDGFQRMFFFMV